MTRKPLTWFVVAVLAAGVGFGLYWFAPWRLFTDTTVREALTVPEATTAVEPGASSAAPAAPRPPWWWRGGRS